MFNKLKFKNNLFKYIHIFDLYVNWLIVTSNVKPHDAHIL
jgi:hypothetical protein